MSGSRSMKGKRPIDPFSNEYAISKSHKEIHDFYRTANDYFKDQSKHSNVKDLIGAALNRKTMSNSY